MQKDPTKYYPVQAQYRVLPQHICREVWFQALGKDWQLFFFYTWMNTNDAGIWDVNMIEFTRTTGVSMPDYYNIQSYIKTMNQDGLERVVELDNGKKILYPYVLWYGKAGVLNLALEHDADCYSKWIMEGVPEEYMRAKFNIINESDFDFDKFMLNVDFKVRESMRVTPKWEEYFPKSYVSHVLIDTDWVPFRQINACFVEICDSYPRPNIKKEHPSNYNVFYQWIKKFPDEYQMAVRYLQKHKAAGTKNFPKFIEYFERKMYLFDGDNEIDKGLNIKK